MTTTEKVIHFVYAFNPGHRLIVYRKYTDEETAKRVENYLTKYHPKLAVHRFTSKDTARMSIEM